MGGHGVIAAPAEQPGRSHEQHGEKQREAGREREPRIDEARDERLANPSSRPATRHPRRSPTPPMTTTISAFIVNTTPRWR